LSHATAARPASPPATEALTAVEALTQGIGAARVLELDVSRAEAVAKEASERLGIAPDAYVVALVGGTGVGKSTILNALGGRNVSEAGVRRPTTSAPVAWVAESAADEVRPLLDRLGVGRTRTHSSDELARVVIVDLPDVDSLDASHASTVETVLPKLDVVAWVTDPEKYADSALHDAFLRDWLPRLDRQIVILNKADRLDGEARESVARDLERVLIREMAPGARTPPVIATSAADGANGVAELRDWLASAADAKAVVAGRLASSARAALGELASEAGVSAADTTPLVGETEQRRAMDGAVDEVLRVVDLKGTESQAVAATRARARRRGTGPMGLLTSAIYRFSGREARAANPAAYLRRWRERGGLARATELIRRAIADALPGVPPALRARYAAAGEGRDLERRLDEAIDRLVGRESDVEAPTSRLWPFIGLLQTANTLLLIFAVAWVILWVIARPQVASYDLPILGPVPAPMVLLFVALAIGYVLARFVAIHAGWLGRRWARSMSSRVRTGVTEIVAAESFGSLARLEAARRELADAWRRSGAAVTERTKGSGP
jgi:energy-coupling factor transporter ATP-binding protein EcfA2